MLSRSVAFGLLASLAANGAASGDADDKKGEIDGKKHTGQWYLTTGQCQQDAKGCISSPGFPAPYTGGSSCVIKVEEDFNGLETVAFDTEENIDTLVINSLDYSGNWKPTIKPKLNEDGSGYLTFRSDAADVRSGFEICPEDTGGPMWSVSEGLCDLDDETKCITAPNGGEGKAYGNHQTCEIEVPKGFGGIKTGYLDLEVGDTLTGEKTYTSGIAHKLYPHAGDIHWVTDENSGGKGWKLCPIDLGSFVCEGCESMPLSVRLASQDPHIGAATGFYNIDDAPTVVGFHRNPIALTLAAVGCAAVSALTALAWVVVRRKQNHDPFTVSQSETSVA